MLMRSNWLQTTGPACRMALAGRELQKHREEENLAEAGAGAQANRGVQPLAHTQDVEGASFPPVCFRTARCVCNVQV